MSYQGLSDEEPLFAPKNEKYPAFSKIVGLISIVIAVTVVITSVSLYAFTGRVMPFDYGVVIDAGSSHTQVYLYRWLGNKESGTGHVLQENTCTYPYGIASVSDPSVILNCTNLVVKSIPSAMKMQTPLYLGATAGMRLLNMTNPEDAALRLLALQFALKETQVNVKDVSIITGFEEGLYSWITVNFLTDTLNPKKKTHPWNVTFGALDLGGASTQFSFAINPFGQKHDDVISLRLYGNEYKICSKSFLCFGSDQIFIRHQSLLVKNISSNETIIDPCLPTGNFSTSEALSLFGGPCTSTPEFADWLLMPGFKNRTFTFKGSSDFETCKANIDVLLNASLCEEKGFTKCSEKINISNAGVKFMAFSSFSYVASFLNATSASLKEIVDLTEKWCKLSWDEIKSHSYKPSDCAHLARYCFSSIYMIHLLTENYGFNEASWENLIFQDQIGKSDIGWSLGYMINATNAIPEEKITEPSISVTVFVILVIWSVILLIFGLVFLFKYNKLRRNVNYSQFEDRE